MITVDLIKRYLDFNYGLGFIICVLIFLVYLYCLKLKKNNLRESISKNEIFSGLVSSVYVVTLLGGTLLNRTVNAEYAMKLDLFWSYREVLLKNDISLALQIVYNVVAFIPWGFLFSWVTKDAGKIHWSLISATIFSLLIELIQLVFKLGLFEFDDIFHNVLGATIGYGIWRGIVFINNKRRNRIAET